MHNCKPFNDERGCTADEKDCPLRARQVCDDRLSSGSACAGDHSRKKCPRAVRWGPPSGRLYEGNRWDHSQSETTGCYCPFCRVATLHCNMWTIFTFQTGSRSGLAMVVAWVAVPKFMESADTGDGVNRPLQRIREPLARSVCAGLSVCCGLRRKTTRNLLRLPNRPSRNQCVWNLLTSWTQKRSSVCSRADPSS